MKHHNEYTPNSYPLPYLGSLPSHLLCQLAVHSLLQGKESLPARLTIHSAILFLPCSLQGLMVYQNCGSLVHSKATRYLSFTKTDSFHISYPLIPKYPLITMGFSFYPENMVTKFHRCWFRVQFAHFTTGPSLWPSAVLGSESIPQLCYQPQCCGQCEALKCNYTFLRIQSDPTAEVTTPREKSGSWAFSYLQNALFKQGLVCFY